MKVEQLVKQMGYNYLGYNNNTHYFVANDKEFSFLLPNEIVDRLGDKYIIDMINDVVKGVV